MAETFKGALRARATEPSTWVCCLIGGGITWLILRMPLDRWLLNQCFAVPTTFAALAWLDVRGVGPSTPEERP